MELEEAKKISLELIESTKAAYLTTIDSEGYPITRAMFNLRKKTSLSISSKQLKMKLSIMTNLRNFC